MNKTEQVIINIMKALYNIDEEKEKKLIASFADSSEEDKEKIANELYSYYKRTEKNFKTLINNINKTNNEIEEYKEKLNADNILSQID